MPSKALAHRVHQIFGANTGVGKTVFTTALCRASEHLNQKIAYLKPIATGDQNSRDDYHVKRFTNVETTCLFTFDQPVSPHLAAQRSSSTFPADDEINAAIRSHIARANSNVFVETAGGVHSPTLSGASQLEAYRPLRLPTILVASPALGGISSTISSYESLHIRGYDVDFMLCLQDDTYENWRYFRDWCRDRNLPFESVEKPPEELTDRAQDHINLKRYYEDISQGPISNVIQQLQATHEKRLNRLDKMPRKALDKVWWPFVQHSFIDKEEKVMTIDSAHRDTFAVHSDGSSKALVDGSASWWTQCLGHGNHELTLAAANASGRYGHVLFPEAIHEPALKLSETLLDTVGKNWASRVFFSDNGSTGLEVALKMALKSFRVRYPEMLGPGKELSVLGLTSSYHGDTIGVMDASDPNVYNAEVDWYRGRGYWLHPPSYKIEDGSVAVTFNDKKTSYSSLDSLFDIQHRLKHDELAAHYRKFIEEKLRQVKKDLPHLVFGALIMEPICMGAGGMLFIDPLFQHILVDIARNQSEELLHGVSKPAKEGWKGMPVIFDEVFVGLHRLGHQSTTTLLQATPDIACYAKILTGGLVPMSVTLASNSIFETFEGDTKAQALLHGHSYTAHPVGCAVANKTFEEIEKVVKAKDWQNAKTLWDGKLFSLWDKTFVEKVSRLENIEGSMAMGTVLAIYIRDQAGQSGYQSTASADFLAKLRTPEGEDDLAIHARPLGNTVYFMSSLNTSPTTLRAVEKRILQALTA